MSSNSKTVALLILCCPLWIIGVVHAQDMDHTIRPELLRQITEHVHIIPDEKRPLVPNVGFVVGTRATLVIDTGLGHENGTIVLGVANDLSDSKHYYVASTHTHPEHDLGVIAFPPSTTVIRSTYQEQDIEASGMDLAYRFAEFSDRTAELLDGAYVRPSDIIFEDNLRLDLGGIYVQLINAGPAHTRGDLAFYVEEDDVLFTGDVVMDQYPMPLATNGTITAWLQTLDKFEALNPKWIIPCHYAIGGPELVQAYRQYFMHLNTRVRSMHISGITRYDIVTELMDEVPPMFESWTDPARIEATVRFVLRGAEE